MTNTQRNDAALPTTQNCLEKGCTSVVLASRHAHGHCQQGDLHKGPWPPHSCPWGQMTDSLLDTSSMSMVMIIVIVIHSKKTVFLWNQTDAMAQPQQETQAS